MKKAMRMNIEDYSAYMQHDVWNDWPLPKISRRWDPWTELPSQVKDAKQSRAKTDLKSEQQQRCMI